jgi:hypothetical protein
MATPKRDLTVLMMAVVSVALGVIAIVVAWSRPVSGPRPQVADGQGTATRTVVVAETDAPDSEDSGVVAASMISENEPQ